MTPHAINDPDVRSIRMPLNDFYRLGFDNYRDMIFEQTGIGIDRELEVVVFEQDPRPLRFEPAQ